jgi:cyclic beta-1,2-glucan synthetase
MPTTVVRVPVADIAAKSPFFDPTQPGPLRDEIFGQAYLEDYARRLAAASEVSFAKPARSIDERLREDDRMLREAHAAIRDASRGQETLTTDAEWLLDNYFVVEDVLREVRRDLPAGYYRELPRLTVGPLAGFPRTLALAVGLVVHTDSSLNESQVRDFVRSYQAVRHLTIGELWAVPTMLRLALIENLRRLAQQMIETRHDREYAAKWVAEQAQTTRGGRELREPERRSDASLVGIIQGLREFEGSAQPLVEWLEQWLARENLTATDLLRRENRRHAANQVSVGNCITSLRLLNALDWNTFVEQTSVVELAFRTDPTGEYVRQNFETRDRCRHEIERLSRGSDLAELEVAQRALHLAAAGADERRKQIAYYLIDRGQIELARAIDYRPRFGERRRSLFRDWPRTVFFGGLLFFAVAMLAIIVAISGARSPLTIIAVIAVTLLPVSELAVGVVNFLLTKLVSPTVLPKLDGKNGIPQDCATIVVMPSMLIRPESAALLLERLEQHHLANPDPQLRFALLTDFADADAESQPTDAGYVQAAMDGVAALNRKYAPGGPDLFYVFHRKRQWNPSEGKWMGWERKRGKLQEFNKLLRGATDTSYRWKSGASELLANTRYVITLDADTNLPRETARRMICTLAHPLNRARLSNDQMKVTDGYAILQPRMSFLFMAGTRSRFAKLLASSAGIDPYQAAVSDVYMDLFGAGSFIGKGMYDVDAFEAATEPAFPDNRILSHDLIESNFARCALATDIELFDEFPARYHAYARREQRWIRGDWQILPWLFPTTPANPSFNPHGRRRNVLGIVERWKIFDNLRRSLVGPSIVVMTMVGWTVLPGSPWLWTSIALLVAMWPMVMFLANGFWGAVTGSFVGAYRAARGTLPGTASQCLLSLGLMLDQSRGAVNAIATTLGRLFFKRRHLLEWETAAATERRLGTDLPSFLRTMGMTSLFAWALIIVVAVWNPHALFAALPILLVWLCSPALAWWVSLPLPVKEFVLTEADRIALRRIARKTWGFFETFVGPEDNWLPPDNYQESPKGEIAHRTSPTNMGLLLLSTLAAHDFGFLSLGRMTERIGHTIDTLEKLEKFRGHILNWFDTRSLAALHPEYVSVVDSGNLLACLIALKQGLLEKLSEPVPGPQHLLGIADTMALAEEGFDSLQLSLASREPLASRFRQVRAKLAAPPADMAGWNVWVQELLEQARPLTDLADKQADRMQCAELQRWVNHLRDQVYDLIGELQAVCPWVADVPALAALRVPNELVELRDRVAQTLNTSGGVGEWADKLPAIKLDLEKLKSCDERLVTRLLQLVISSTATTMAKQLRSLAARCDRLSEDMDFTFLYNSDRHLFAIGFNKAVGRLDNAHYDLLASECRITSFLAVARGEVPRKHWFQLGRPVTIAAGRQGLLSWGGTMFEYLMPRLLLPSFDNTLLDIAEQTAVARQIEFGRKNGVPWGVSESGYYVLDAFQTYQYQSFGVPGLGLKRGLQNDVVIAPYATLMAVVIDPHAVRVNLDELRKFNGEGPYGVYEAVDFTRRRLLADQRCLVVRQYMAHHQGMSFIALANRLLDNTMPRRLRAEPMVRANELLLQERVPVDAPVVIPPEDDESTRRVALTLQIPVVRKLTTADTPGPRTHLISNGQYSLAVTNAGGGYSTCRGLDITRWREDRTRDAYGLFLYVRDLSSGKYWSVAHQPCGGIADRYEVTFSVDKVDFRRLDGNFETHTEITISPENNVEVRRVTVTNHGPKAVDLDITSYAEIALADRKADLAHPAFQKLFLETEWVPAQKALLCRRRPRSTEQQPIWAVHTVATEGRTKFPPTFETDRARFLGRRRDASRPACMNLGEELTGATGPVLDPVMSLRQKMHVEPGASASVAFAVAFADTREEALGLADQYNAYHAVIRVFDLAWAHSHVELRDLHVSVEESHLYQRLAGLVVNPAVHLRAPADQIRGNHQDQSGLWKFGISGDLPIVMVRVKDGDELGLLRQVVAAHNFWRVNGLAVDLIVMNEHPEGYLEGFHEQILGVVRAGDANAFFDRPGGVFVRKADQMSADDRYLLAACARVVLLGQRGPLSDQLDLPEKVPANPPLLRPERAGWSGHNQLFPRPDLILNNGLGGFTQDGHEYVITFDTTNAGTPMPWSNVVANAQAGFFVTEAGGGCTWSGNSQTNRLTPWTNDPVSDTVGEAIYIRDEQSGEFWSVTALPVPVPLYPQAPKGAQGSLPQAKRANRGGPVRARHGQGYSVFERVHTGLEQELRLSMPTEDPVKLLRLKITNRSGQPRRLSATFFAEWVLGTNRDANSLHVVTDIDGESGAVFARNAFNPEFGKAVAFADVSLRPRTVTGDRTEFLGRNGSAGDPAALHRTELSNRTGAGLDPCAAIMAKFDLAVDESKEIVFVIGQAVNDVVARMLATRYRDPATSEQAFRDSVHRWDEFLSAIQVRTPDVGLNLLVNRWLPYQALACRFWGRTALYQSGGAYGYRDQLQDSMALVYGRPELARAHLLRVAARQFLEGDVQHWWHPPGGQGVRTRFSDDYLFLPFVTSFYVEKTGDEAALDATAPFLKAALLAQGQDEDYGSPSVTEEAASLYEHCVRALDRAAPRGTHGLPLMGCGDWNDGMNRVGHDGKGESVWLAWFLADTYRRFAPLCKARGDTVRASDYVEKADQLIAAVEHNAWDGAWYRRAYFDDGTPLGSATNDECQIDSLPQSWAVITGSGDPERAKRAMAAVEERLIRVSDRLVLLFFPPFDHGGLQPGYIKGYVPGIRENGGQYTHAATWLIQAVAKLGRGRQAKELIDILNPVRLSEDAERVSRYKVEPYVIAADVYGRAPHIGRGGWTWYTGSASWYWRVIVESVLGLQLKGKTLRVEPCLPPDWPSFEMTYRHGKTAYRINVENPDGVETGVREVFVNDQRMDDGVIQLTDDSVEQRVRIVMGATR